MTGNPPLGPSVHEDTFTRDNLPPPEACPDLKLEGFEYPEYLNAAVERESKNLHCDPVKSTLIFAQVFYSVA